MTSVVDKLNRPIRDLRLSITDRCNFRCTYCMPKDQQFKFLKREELLSYEEIERYLKLMVQLGVEKVKLTGGEPLLRKDVCTLVEKLAAIDGINDLAMVTNGVRLVNLADQLKSAGLQRLTVSLDCLDPQTFLEVSGDRGSVEEVLKGLDAARRAGFENIKINTVIQKGLNDSSILEMAEFGRKEGYTIRFIEFMDVGNVNQWQASSVINLKDMIAQINEQYPLEPTTANYTGEVAKRYSYKDGKGEIGIISSISQPFCGDCHRGRITADGHFYKCLFAKEGIDIKSLLRSDLSDEELLNKFAAIWQLRDDQYSVKRAELKDTEKAEMFHIGG